MPATLDSVTESSVYVVATTLEGTRAALSFAIPLARGADAKLVVLVPHVVSYAVDVSEPSESSPSFVKQYQDLARELGGAATVRFCLCRSLTEVVAMAAAAKARVVVGGPAGRWITSPEERFSNDLIRAGCPTVFVATGVNTTQRRVAPLTAMILALVALSASAQDAAAIQYGAFFDAAVLGDSNTPANHLFRNRGTTPDVDELTVNMAGAYIRKMPVEASRFGFEATVHGGRDSNAFGFSNVAPNVRDAGFLLHGGPTDVSYLAPVGKGLAIQGGIFSSLIGYDSLYAKDNLNYTRPWGADYTPYLMTGVNASYPATPALTVTGFLITGYFHLAHANDAPSVGAQLAFKANEAVTVKQTVLYGSHQPETALANWRVLSDTWLERKTKDVTVALEYQFGSEDVAAAGNARAQWMSAQAPVQWRVAGPWAVAVRPEFAWDRDGRWIGAPESVVALTATLEYRRALGDAQAILRGEYRVDNSGGIGGGFFADADNHLVPTQNLFIAAAIFTFDGTVKR